jgi:fatty-acyl-CoA synthase
MGSIDTASDRDRIKRQAMTGWPLVGAEVRVVDDKGHEVLHDGAHVGEIAARSDGVMKGYWSKPGETEAVIKDGWLLTGDMATIDADGFIQIVDRRKDIIVSGGEDIPSIEIEQCISQHEDVLECAVVAFPDPRWGEIPAAFVVMKEGRSTSDQELLQFCHGRLAAFKCPKTITFLPALPKGGTGKVLKKELRKLKIGR